MKQTKLKPNIKKLIIRLLFILIFILGYLLIKYRFLIMGTTFNKFSQIKTNQVQEEIKDTNTNINTDLSPNLDLVQIKNEEYGIIAEEKNFNYSGTGQEKVNNKTGYFTTFKTKENTLYKEYKQKGDVPWTNKPYWDGTMESDGCGITAMSIILSGYNRNLTPEDLRQTYYPYLLADNISQELDNSFGIKNSGFYFDSVHLSKESMQKHLKTNRPILICVWNQPKENRWTTVSHYMVLLAADDNDKVYVSNPNGLENLYNSSGWYDINEITPYLAKAMYILEKN